MRHYQRLTPEHRYTIESLSREPCSQEFIARTIGLHSSSVGRELKRAGMTRQTYCHLTVQKDADTREWRDERFRLNSRWPWKLSFAPINAV